MNPLKTLTGIALAGALALGVAGCEKKDTYTIYNKPCPSEKKLIKFQQEKLSNGEVIIYYFCAP
ncbi:MAG TPA: hypothetical protein VJ208_02000 [Candidatus Nanoarchaeia archaeon]|nr:hypothetical protein [Candidatus Nanoarchaeia archaeon]